MSKKMIKYACLLTIMITLIYSFMPIIIPFGTLHPQVNAASINKDDVYRGLAIALVLILLSKLGQAGDSSSGRVELPDPSDSDLDLLAKVINGEARGEPYEGQVAVGAVVLNRVRNAEFPNTIEGVIYQKGQFSCVKDGQINLVPTASSYKAAREALDGRDPSLGALYFYNPDKAITLWWLSQRETTVVIGDHVFAK